MYGVPIPLPTPAPVLSVVPSNMQSCIASTLLLLQRLETLKRHAWSLRLLNPLEFMFIMRLGSGASGSVCLYMNMKNSSFVAVKEYHPGYSGRNIKYEARFLCILECTGFVPQVYGLLHDPLFPDKTMLVQEYFGNGRTLMSILRDPNIVLNSADKIYIAYQLVCGLMAIHGEGVLVNDIKSNNVLVDITSMPPYQIRYIDFDLATYREGTRYLLSTAKYVSTISRGISAIWLAPEVRMGHQTTQQSDIYSVGYLISELECLELHEIVSVCTQEKPYDRPNLNEIFNIISPLYFNSQRSQQNLMSSVTYPTVATPYGPLSMY